MSPKNKTVLTALRYVSLATAIISGLIAILVAALLAHVSSGHHDGFPGYVSSIDLTLLAVMLVFFVFSLTTYRDLVRTRARK